MFEQMSDYWKFLAGSPIDNLDNVANSLPASPMNDANGIPDADDILKTKSSIVYNKI